MDDRSIEPSPTEKLMGGVGWAAIGRVIIKALLLYVILNIVFAAFRPLDFIGNISLYNSVLPGRDRLPYGEVPSEDFNLTLNNLPAMFAAHRWIDSEKDDEFRVLVIGDSATWGWFLRNEDTLTGQLNHLNLVTKDRLPVVFYNLGYPVMSLTKDLLLLDEAMVRGDPDLILWPVTMQSFAHSKQLEHPLLQENASRVRSLITRFDLDMDPADPRLKDPGFVDNTLYGRRRELADLLRLQSWGLSWAATGHDQAIPDEIPLRSVDFEEDYAWLDIEEPRPLSEDDLAFDVLSAGVARAETTPIVIINEPIFISNGRNSDIRYNAFYPRWAYDHYRDLMEKSAAVNGWHYIDLWDAIPPDEFTDTPVHLTPQGNRQLAKIVADKLAGLELKPNDE